MPPFYIPRRKVVGFGGGFLGCGGGVAGNGIMCVWFFGGFVCMFVFLKSLLSVKGSQITFLSRFQQQRGKEKPFMLRRRKLNVFKKKKLMKLSQISSVVSMAMINVLYTYANCNTSAYAIFPTNIKALWDRSLDIAIFRQYSHTCAMTT